MEKIAIIIPVLDDWDSVRALLPAVDSALSGAGARASILIVDDGSRSPAPMDLAAGPFRGILGLRSLRLRRNFGHQRAVAIGLSFLHKEGSCEAAVVMDADGEDRPEDIPRLLERLRESEGKAIVFARRGRRSEGPAFRIFYLLYRILHAALAGIEAPPGNFSAVPAAFLPAVTGSPESWVHYAASARQLRIPIEYITADRGGRLRGRSRMNFSALVAHGLRALSVQSDAVVARLAVAAALFLAGWICLASARWAVLAGDWWRPTWWQAAAETAIEIFRAAAVACGVGMLAVYRPWGQGVIPLRDAELFIEGVTELGSRDAAR